MPIKINHVAVVVSDLESSLPFWRDLLGLSGGQTQDVPQEQVRIAFLEAGDSHIELVQPTSETSGIAQYLAKRGAGMHHICFEVEDLEATMRHMAANGVTLLNDVPKEREGQRYVFIHPKSTGGVLVELYEQRSNVDAPHK